jgi:RND family efflux transporter MFP subunit
MPVIDWTSPGVMITMAASGAILIVLGMLFYFLPAKRINALALLVCSCGGLGVGTAMGLYLVPTSPSVAFTNPTPARLVESLSAGSNPASSSGRMASDALERFRQVTASQRMTQLNRLPDAATAWHTVERGEVNAVLERGTLESADKAEVVVKVHARKADAPAATIRKVLVEDGAMVKKDKLLVELDDTELQQRLADQKVLVEDKKTELAQVQQQAELDTERANLDLEEAQHQLVLTEREQRTRPGGDAEQKKGMELQVKEARQLVKARTFAITTTKTRTEAARRAAQTSLDAETAHLKELESDLAHCKITAPRDGHVIFHFPELATSRPTLAAGETVKEGQKLMYLPDLSKMQVRALIHEARITFVRPEQSARVRVDAFPDRTLTGKVDHIATAGQVQRDVRVYPVMIALPDDKLGLKPGMSAQVRIQVTRSQRVPCMPTRAVVIGQPSVCFVKSGDEIEERPVVVGLGDDDFVEILRGVREGEQVLRDPRAVAGRLAK